MQSPTTVADRTRTGNAEAPRFILGEHGAALIEYALVVGLIAVVAMVAVGLVGGSVSGSLDTSASSLAAAEEANYPTETAGVDGKVKATFVLIDGKVVLASTEGDGWTMKVTKDTGTRINTRFKNDTTGQVIRVNGWVNRKGTLKTKVVVR